MCSENSLGNIIVTYLFLYFWHLSRLWKRYVLIQLLLLLIQAFSQLTKISC